MLRMGRIRAWARQRASGVKDCSAAWRGTQKQQVVTIPIRVKARLAATACVDLPSFPPFFRHTKTATGDHATAAGSAGPRTTSTRFNATTVNLKQLVLETSGVMTNLTGPLLQSRANPPPAVDPDASIPTGRSR